jgi:spore cortex biosynthesis protein YabQ
MNGAILVELRFFWTSVLWGVALLVIYDFLRIERRLISHNSFFIAVEDLIYWVIASLLIFNMMFQLNDGIIRGFSILAMLLGMLIYHHILSSYIVDITAGILIKIKNVIFAIISFILTPFKFLLKGIKKVFGFITRVIKKLTNILRKTLKKIRKPSRITVNDNDIKKTE